jgi:hypothetical protein
MPGGELDEAARPTIVQIPYNKSDIILFIFNVNPVLEVGEDGGSYTTLDLGSLSPLQNNHDVHLFSCNGLYSIQYNQCTGQHDHSS